MMARSLCVMAMMVRALLVIVTMVTVVRAFLVASMISVVMG